MSYRILPNKTIVDYNRLKVFGFQRANLLNKLYDPLNIRYLKSPRLGRFEMPKNTKNREIHFLIRNYQQAQQYSKTFSPRGIVPNMNSRFNKADETEDLQDFKVMLMRSGKKYNDNEVKFLVDINYSKPEIKQILSKMYNLDIEKITTAILPGRVKRDMTLNQEKQIIKYYRTDERKVAVVTLNKSIKVPELLTKLEKPQTATQYDNEDPDRIKLTRKRIERIQALRNEKINDISVEKALETIPQSRRFILGIGSTIDKQMNVKKCENKIRNFIWRNHESFIAF